VPKIAAFSLVDPVTAAFLYNGSDIFNEKKEWEYHKISLTRVLISLSLLSHHKNTTSRISEDSP
jgi:hypothetical protein